MLSDQDVWRAAMALVDRYGTNACAEAVKRADDMVNTGNADGRTDGVDANIGRRAGATKGATWPRSLGQIRVGRNRPRLTRRRRFTEQIGQPGESALRRARSGCRIMLPQTRRRLARA